MFNALTLAAGYIVAYCVHTPQGREMAKRVISEGMRQLGAAEKGIARTLLHEAKPKKEGTA